MWERLINLPPACALTGDRSHNLLVCGTTLHQLSNVAGTSPLFFIIKLFIEIMVDSHAIIVNNIEQFLYTHYPASYTSHILQNCGTISELRYWCWYNPPHLIRIPPILLVLIMNVYLVLYNLLTYKGLYIYQHSLEYWIVPSLWESLEMPFCNHTHRKPTPHHLLLISSTSVLHFYNVITSQMLYKRNHIEYNLLSLSFFHLSYVPSNSSKLSCPSISQISYFLGLSQIHNFLLNKYT